MNRLLATLGCAAAVLAGAATSAAAESRGFAISVIHTATYGSKENCPKGGNGGPVEIKQRILMAQGYTREQAVQILANMGKDEKGEKVEITKRGRVNDQLVNVQNYPASAPDPKIETVQGRFAYGLNLDGRNDPSDFTDPETKETGVDNQMWRVLGCFAVYDVRRPVVPYNEDIAWDTAIDAMPAWLLSVTGDDLSRDGDVTVTFDRALNIVMRDAAGRVLPGSSYAIDPDPRSHSTFKGHIKDGVLRIEPGDFAMQGESQFYPWLRFSGTQLRLKLNDDGTLSGLIGGYQPWRDYFYYLAVRGEETGQVDIPGVFYAMQRFADAVPDPVSGENTAISAAYYIQAVPAFLSTRDDRVVSVAHVPQALIHTSHAQRTAEAEKP
jgi:hypothetical protein